MKAWVIPGKPDKFCTQLSVATGDRYPKKIGIPHITDK